MRVSGQLTGQLVDPLLELAKENTSPAIERSVLLRMGFSSLEAKVDRRRVHGKEPALLTARATSSTVTPSTSISPSARRGLR